MSGYQVVLLGGNAPGLDGWKLPTSDIMFAKSRANTWFENRLNSLGIRTIAIHHLSKLMERMTIFDILKNFVGKDTVAVGLSSSFLMDSFNRRLVACRTDDEYARMKAINTFPIRPEICVRSC